MTDGEVHMEKVVVFLDYANINATGSQRKLPVDYSQLLNYLADPEEGRFLQEAFAYVPIDPRREHAMDERVRELWDAGYLVKSKVGTIAGQSYKCDFDVEMTLDMSRLAYEMKPDIVVLASGDGDFVPVVLELRSKGIRVEVAAYRESMSGQLMHRCSGFIDLGYALDGTTHDTQAYEAVYTVAEGVGLETSTSMDQGVETWLVDDGEDVVYETAHAEQPQGLEAWLVDADEDDHVEDQASESTFFIPPAY